ncbi:muscular LMNA-interacting protein isoform X3 [Syngnathus scovelli]|uniref:muscular LMNA-interacting protein isoform X3 n=1 Tax=Syngnathus scovelli TaxID=161590 RepID=UPI00211087E5|nr:uncharacterized protein mlip isoform X3 [Syngnathus scovelli]
MRSSNKNLTGSYEKTSGETMSDGKILTAEIIFIKESLESGEGIETKINKSPLAQVICSQASTSLGGQSENTLKHSGTASMETTANKHQSLSQQWGHNSSGRVEVSSVFSPEKPSTMSATCSAHVSPTLASSRESILSESWDRDKCWPAMPLSSLGSPTSLSRTVSPWSSVRSGVFSPAVVQIRKHALAPGSSLVHLAQSCFSSCDSLASSICPQSPSFRHRPPLTRLSLLTAILRKGRLPVLSASLQRPYTPCWPVNPVTLTFCKACSAASSVASIPLALSSPFSSSTSLDSQTFAHREPIRSVPSHPTELPNEHSRPRTPVKRCSGEIRPRSVPKWEEVISPPRLESSVLSRDPPLRLCSKLKNVPPSYKEISLQHSYVFKRPEQKPSFAHMYLSSTGECIHPTLVQQPVEKSRRSNSSLSKLRVLSERLRSPSPCSPLSSPSHSLSASGTTSPALPSLPKAPSLTLSRYTPVSFSGSPSPIGSPTPTPSPATLFRDLTPSPSFSLRSTPSPRPGSGISDCSDKEGKKRKIIDEQVQSENILKRGDQSHEDTHAEMCSPAQLRQQSEELYATIDEILADSNPQNKTATKVLVTDGSLRNKSAKSLGRETKYASLSSMHPSGSVEKRLMDSKKTKSGIVRPMMTIPRLSKEDGGYRHCPFRETDVYSGLKGNPNPCKEESVGLEDMRGNGHTSRKHQVLQKERTSETSPFTVCELQIIEPDGQLGHFEGDASAPLRSEAYGTHI